MVVEWQKLPEGEERWWLSGIGGGSWECSSGTSNGVLMSDGMLPNTLCGINSIHLKKIRKCEA